MKTLSLVLLLFCFGFQATAQVEIVEEELPTGKQHFKPLLTFNGGVSLPLGKYNMLTDKSDDRSSAGMGCYAELGIAINPMRKSNWKTGILLGYLYNPFEYEASQIEYDLTTLNATPWHIGYALVGISYRSKKKVYVGMGVYAGIMAYAGGSIITGKIDGYGMWQTYQWDYGVKAALAVKGNVQLGYRISDYLSVELIGHIFYGTGVRKGEMKLGNYYGFSNQILMTPSRESERINQNQTSVITANIGLGLCYRFYDEEATKQYKFNAE